MRFVVYASSSKKTPDKFLNVARILGEQLAAQGHICVNGGGNTGGMGALNRACKAAGGKVICIIHEKWVVDGEKFDYADEMIITSGDDLSERKTRLLDQADCVISLPGGIGTCDEIMDFACRKQLGFLNIPICVINVEGYFSGLLTQMNRAVSDGLVSIDHADTVHAEDTVEGALDWCKSQRLELSRIDSSNLLETPPLPTSTSQKKCAAETSMTLTGFPIILRNLALLPVIFIVYTWMFMQTISLFMNLSGEHANQ